MSKYHKIQTVFNRDPDNNYKTLIEGQWARPEFGYLCHNKWRFDEKIDGTNIRVIWDGKQVEFRGRTDRAQIPNPLMEKLQELFPVQLLADTLQDPLILYGEGFGNKIQKVGKLYNPNGVNFILFDVFAPLPAIWLERESVEDIAHNLNILVTPIVGYGTLFDGIDMARDGFMSTFGNFKAEGLIMRPLWELRNRMGSRIIAKIKHRDFQ